MDCSPWMHNSRISGKEVVMENTVAREEECFYRRVQEWATLDKRAYGMMGSPSVMEFKNMLRSMLIYNCRLMPDSVIMANKIHYPNIHSIKLKTVRRQLTTVVTD